MVRPLAVAAAVFLATAGLLLAFSVFRGPIPLPLYALAAVVLVTTLVNLLRSPARRPEIIVTDQDAARLSRLLDTLAPERREAASALMLELARARVVPAKVVPGDVVTMNSRVRFEELHSGRRTEARLVYPSEARDAHHAVEAADTSDDVISVLEPVGSALLGMRVGQSIDWRMPSGRLRRYQIVDVVYQPEGAGDLHL